MSVESKPEASGYVSIEGLAKHFSLSVTSIRSWVRRGVIPSDTYIKLGPNYRFNLAKVEDALLNAPKGDIKFVDPDPAPVQLELELDTTAVDQDL